MCDSFGVGGIQHDSPPPTSNQSLVPMLLCAFAFTQRGVDRIWDRLRLGAASRPLQHAAVLGVAAVAANPVATVASMTSDGSEFPDHRGAAQFVRTLNITPDDIVLAEDVLQQTYYLGHVDY